MLQDNIKKGQMTFFYIDRKIPCLKKITWVYVIHHPALLGLDMVMACFLLAMVVGGQKNLRILIIWTIAACSSLLAYWYLPENSHVVVGALFGGIVGIFWKEKQL